MSRTILFSCPQCEKSIEVGARMAGYSVRCPHCRADCTVPRANETPQTDTGAGTSSPSVPTLATSADSESTGEPNRPPKSQVAEPQPAETADWYLRIPEGLQFGPVTRSTLQQWVLEGRIDESCQLRSLSDSQWQTADEVFPALKLPPFDPRPLRQKNATIQLEKPAGLFVLVLAILGWITLCPLLTVVAWMAATEDLREIARGRRESGQRIWSLAAIRLAQLELILVIVSMLAFVSYFVFRGLTM